MEPKFTGGINIAVKIPKSKYEATVKFYRDILKLDVTETPIDNPTVSRTHKVKFGNNVIWLDCGDHYTHSETWLELKTPDVEQATRHLAENDVHPCDELEKYLKICTGYKTRQVRFLSSVKRPTKLLFFC